MVPAAGRDTFSSQATSCGDADELGESPMKTLSIVTLAIFLGLGGAAMANGQDSQQGGESNATGPNPFMPEFSTPASPGYSAFAQHPVQHHVVHHQVKK
jgi:hypothetical protein